MVRGAIIACALLVSATSISAKSVQQEFNEAWVERHQRHEADYNKSNDALKLATTEYFQNVPADESDAKAKLDTLLNAIRDYGYQGGRLYMIHNLRALMEKKPSTERADMWLQEQADQLIAKNAKTKEQAAALGTKRVGENGETGQSVLLAISDVVISQGQIQGQFDELVLIDKNLSSFYQAKAVQDQRRAEKRAGFFARLAQLSQQFDAPQSNNWSATCTRMGMFTNCHGN